MGLRKALVRVLGDLREILDDDFVYVPKISAGTEQNEANVHVGASDGEKPPMIIEPGPLVEVLRNGALEFFEGKLYITYDDDPPPTLIYLTDWDGTRIQDFDGTDLYIHAN